MVSGLLAWPKGPDHPESGEVFVIGVLFRISIMTYFLLRRRIIYGTRL
ncbi:hypothetical protein EmuJ_000845200 [Echinococcus multilocularis]|uniref:Uncharacterized protein n=1 Tax=Echinococcus multilocularis TaxID=6211 RepID=A0A068YET0_ECHMU|nr:hypothetical protein EmuJ_000845200 [Echinococcus multilocularis]